MHPALTLASDCAGREGTPYLSVVIPTLHRTKQLAGCLNALLSQELEAEYYEIIVVADGPDGNTKELIDELMPAENADRLRFYSLERRSGFGAARNLGWQEARGEWIIFTDDDCEPDSRLLERFLMASYRYPDRALTGTVLVPLNVSATDYDRNTVRMQRADFVTANCCLPKSLLERLRGFDESFPGAWRGDSELYFRLLSNQVQIQRIPNAVVCHQVPRPGWGVSLREEKKNYVNALLFKKYPELYRRHISAGPTWLYYFTVLLAVNGLVFLLEREKLVGTIFLSFWICSIVLFSCKRLDGLSKRPRHIIEISLTSVFIPFLSCFWSIYGAIRYRVLFLN